VFDPVARAELFFLLVGAFRAGAKLYRQGLPVPFAALPPPPPPPFYSLPLPAPALAPLFFVNGTRK
jgi:hypothetical protein